MPGRWYVEGDKICLINEDKTITILTTSWENDRKQEGVAEFIENKEKQLEQQEHILNKRIQKQKERLKNTRSK